jgi:hypothetical protein
MHPQPSYGIQMQNQPGYPNQFGGQTGYPNTSVNGMPQHSVNSTLHQQGSSTGWNSTTPSGFTQQTPTGLPTPPPVARTGKRTLGISYLYFTFGANFHARFSLIGTYTPLLDPNIVRPSPVHAQGARTQTVSPSLSMGGTSGFNGQVTTTAVSPGMLMDHVYTYQELTCRTGQQLNMDEGKLSISIDFGKHSSKPFASSELTRL